MTVTSKTAANAAAEKRVDDTRSATAPVALTVMLMNGTVHNSMEGAEALFERGWVQIDDAPLLVVRSDAMPPIDGIGPLQ